MNWPPENFNTFSSDDAKSDNYTDDELLHLAQQAYQRSDLNQATLLLQKVIHQEKNNSNALSFLGIIQLQLGNLLPASRLLKQALKLEPNNPDIHCNYGNVMQLLGDLTLAISAYQQAIAIKPDVVGYHVNLALVLEQDQQTEKAIESYQQALKIVPNDPNICCDLGRLYSQKKDFTSALQYFQAALSQNDKHVLALVGLGCVLRETDQTELALQKFEFAHKLESENAEVLVNLADSLQELHCFDAALGFYQQAIARRPNDSKLLCHAGHVYRILGQHELATKHYAAAIAAKPDNRLAHHAYSLALLTEQRFTEGWQEYEWRLAEGMVGTSLMRQYEIPYWSGEWGKDLFLWTEQGVGDEIMFAQFAKIAADMSNQSCLECDPRLVPLFQRSFPSITVFPRPSILEEVVQLKTQPPQSISFSHHCAIGSLMGRLGIDKDHQPVEKYLIAEPNRVTYFRNKYRQDDNKLLIGISWRSARSKIYGKIRNIALEEFYPLLNCKECQFISLQYGDNSDVELINQKLTTNILWDDTVDPLTNIDEFAAQIKSLDLVISIDNSTVHLAGALGVPTWVLLPEVPDWRWFLNRNDSLWYKSLTLYRQQKLWQWDEVIQVVAADLQQLLIAKN